MWRLEHKPSRPFGCIEDTASRHPITRAQSDATVGLLCVDERCTVIDTRTMHRSVVS